MTALNVFEELRFIIELLIAELAFIIPTAKQRDHFLLKSILGGVCCIGASFGYFLLEYIPSENTYGLVTLIYVSWYVFLTTITFFYLKICFKVNFAQCILYGTFGYCVSHLEYTIVNETFALGIYPEIRNHLWLYMIICFFSYAMVIGLFDLIFINKFAKIDNGIKMPSKTAKGEVAVYVLFVSLCVITFACQAFFHNGANSNDFTPNYLASIVEFFTCIVYFVLVYVLCSENTVQRDYDIVSQLLYENAKQYAIKKEMIELINTKCHDMKHQIAALKLLDNDEKSKVIEDLENNIMIYDANIDTGNEVLNTLLMEKQLFCINQKIRFSFTGDGRLIDFIDPVTLYSLLGNLLDNSIEGVGSLEDNKKSIELIISKINNNILIQTNNYYNKLNKDSNGEIITSKSDNKHHGYGLKSIKRIAKKYGGSFVTDSDGEIFHATVIIPSK